MIENPSPRYLAEEGTIAEFDELYEPSMATATDSTSAVMGAVANRDLEARAYILKRVLDDGGDVTVTNPDGTNVLHVYFSQRKHDFEAEAPLLRRLIEGGADINGYAQKFGRPLQVLAENLRWKDRDAAPVYDVIFATPGIDFSVSASLKSQKDKFDLKQLIERRGEKRPELLQRMQEYLAKGK